MIIKYFRLANPEYLTRLFLSIRAGSTVRIFPRMPRIAMAQIRTTKGDYGANLARLGAVFAQVAAQDPVPDLVTTPETVTSGYFVEGAVRELAVTTGTLVRDLQGQHAAAKAPPLDVAVAFYEEYQHQLYNSCVYVRLGGKKPEVIHVHRKCFLPTYGLFDEDRFVEKGHEIRAFDTSFGMRAAILICEDAWHSLSGTLAALDGAQLIIVPSAPPARGTDTAPDGSSLPASAVRWERLVRGIAEEHGVYVALTNLVGFEGGKGFPGGSVVIGPAGQVVVRGPLFEEAIVPADLDPALITAARADAPLLSDLRAQLPHLLKGVGRGEWGVGKVEKAPFDPATNGSPTPHIPQPTPLIAQVGTTQSTDLSLDCALVHRWLVSFLRDEVVTRRKFTKALVGLSGGVDSSLVAFLAAEALGKENVLGVRMPYRESSPDSLEHAQLVIDKLGIPSVTLDISAAVDGYLGALEGETTDRRRGNVMARQRMIVLFDLSAQQHALPLGTSNKSERLLGYFTWHADDAPPVNPLGDLYKTQVWELARYVGVPEVIVQKPATADLVKGQTDEQDIGVSYRVADRILDDLLRGRTPRSGSPQEVERVRARLASTHWKRNLPTVAVMSQTAIGEFYLRPVDY
jgi:NAD+ synthetase